MSLQSILRPAQIKLLLYVHTEQTHKILTKIMYLGFFYLIKQAGAHIQMLPYYNININFADMKMCLKKGN